MFHTISNLKFYTKTINKQHDNKKSLKSECMSELFENDLDFR